MNLGTLDRKTGIIAAGLVVAIIVLHFVLADRAPDVVAVSDTVPGALRRLEKLRQVAGTVAGREAVMKQATADLDSREKGMLKADTSAQAQAQLQDLLHRTGAANQIDIRGIEETRVKLLGADYGEVQVTVRFNCMIEQLVNLLASLASQPELIATNEIQITGTNDKNKVIQVRLTLSGVVPRKLAQEKKAGGV